MVRDNQINEVSEILLRELAKRPELLAKIKTHKGAGDKPVPGKRITMKERRNNIRDRFYALSAKTAVIVFAMLVFSSCASTKDPRYEVRSIEHLSGNAYKVTTDSFTVIKIVRGGITKYHPRTVTKKGYIQ